ncbi:IclR family transcriptional regulator [Micromonospora globispora]|nr:IclR family transcriptional regulator [Micromonospora globispora]
MVSKALRLLSLLGDRPGGIALSELSRVAGFPTSTTYRLLGTLVREGYARFDDASKRYTLGLKVFELGQRVSHAFGFTGIALPVMQRVSAHTREATLMSVRDDDKQLYVHYVEGPRQVSVIGEPGKHGPLHCTAMGKVLVAYAPAPAREELVATLPLESLGPNTITDRDAFRVEIDTVRSRGYAIADEEHEAGIRAVGVPILDPTGTATAALSVAAPAFRTPIEDLVGQVPILTEAARELALLLPPRR